MSITRRTFLRGCIGGVAACVGVGTLPAVTETPAPVTGTSTQMQNIDLDLFAAVEDLVAASHRELRKHLETLSWRGPLTDTSGIPDPPAKDRTSYRRACNGDEIAQSWWPPTE